MVRLEQFIVFENDPQVKIRGAPGTIHRPEKRSANGIFLCALKQFNAYYSVERRSANGIFLRAWNNSLNQRFKL